MFVVTTIACYHSDHLNATESCSMSLMHESCSMLLIHESCSTATRSTKNATDTRPRAVMVHYMGRMQCWDGYEGDGFLCIQKCRPGYQAMGDPYYRQAQDSNKCIITNCPKEYPKSCDISSDIRGSSSDISGDSGRVAAAATGAVAKFCLKEGLSCSSIPANATQTYDYPTCYADGSL